MNLSKIIKGLISYTPFLKKDTSSYTTGTNSSMYCYSVWLRHLINLHQNGMKKSPQTIIELGCGSSIGVGLAALLTGSNNYYAFDIRKLTKPEKNIKILDDLIKMFRNKSIIPHKEKFKEIKPYLESYNFPNQLFNRNDLINFLQEKRIKKIKKALSNINQDLNPDLNQEINIAYKAPWTPQHLENLNADLIYSQSVMQYIPDLEMAYRSMYKGLKKQGFISHQIDYKSQGISKEWYGHWQYPPFLWKLINKQRLNPINRVPYSVHIELMKKIGFKILFEKKVRSPSPAKRNNLYKKFKSLNDDDLSIQSAFIIAQK
jgi:hypothetical protein